MINRGEKLICEPEGAVGEGVVQFIAQHNFAVLAFAALVFNLAALQQGIFAMLFSIVPECKGVPANMLPARAKSKNMDASRFIIAVSI